VYQFLKVIVKELASDWLYEYSPFPNEGFLTKEEIES
jgi:hypothetical protein